jgi:hypothetical protein
MKLHIKTLFRNLAELDTFCERNPDFPASLGMANALECWIFNAEIKL